DRSRRTTDPGADRGTLVAEPGRARRPAAPRRTRAPGGAPGGVPGSGGRHGEPAVGSGRLRRRGRGAAGPVRVGVRRRLHGGLLDQATGPLHVPVTPGLARTGDPAGRAGVRERARPGHGAATAATRFCDDLPRRHGGTRLFDRADGQRPRRRAGRDGVSAGAADVAEAFLSSSAAWPRALSMSGSPSIRASSRVRASPATVRTSLVATPPRAPLATTSWWRAYAAIWGRCVMTRAWRCSSRVTAASASPTRPPTSPPIPWSTSSNT